jgi:small subunit ribosomal protein S4
MKFAPTVFASRQLINHGHILVNKKRLNIASAIIEDGDIIEVKINSKNNLVILNATESTERELPDYLDVNTKKLQGTFIRGPKLSDVPYPVKMEPNLVVEFYSR